MVLTFTPDMLLIQPVNCILKHRYRDQLVTVHTCKLCMSATQLGRIDGAPSMLTASVGSHNLSGLPDAPSAIASGPTNNGLGPDARCTTCMMAQSCCSCHNFRQPCCMTPHIRQISNGSDSRLLTLPLEEGSLNTLHLCLHMILHPMPAVNLQDLT